jgi:hypothetical protein
MVPTVIPKSSRPQHGKMTPLPRFKAVATITVAVQGEVRRIRTHVRTVPPGKKIIFFNKVQVSLTGYLPSNRYGTANLELGSEKIVTVRVRWEIRAAVNLTSQVSQFRDEQGQTRWMSTPLTGPSLLGSRFRRDVERAYERGHHRGGGMSFICMVCT